MSAETALLLASIALILGNAFFVAAEYSMVSARRSRLEGLSRKGNRRAKALLKALQNLSSYVAGVQIAITMIGIGTGSLTEPFITEQLKVAFGRYIPHRFDGLLSVASIVIVTFLVVVFGELIPKYLALHASDRIALLTFRPLGLFVAVLNPLVWLVQKSGSLFLKPFGVDLSKNASEVVPKEELLMLIQSGGAEGVLDKTHAEMVTRALKLDVLAARDIMVHRLDIKWLDISLDKDGVIAKLSKVPYTRLPVCRGDIDDMAGVIYLHDFVKSLTKPDFKLEDIVRPVVAIPENLTMERIVQTMREQKTQILIVMDEYGGTSGLITLEDVVEEVFGELEDRLESERPQIEEIQRGRISARADVRFDELVSKLNLPIDPEDNTDTLAQMMVDALDRVARPGDSVETTLGTMRVENMARRRITRVSIQLRPQLLEDETEE